MALFGNKTKSTPDAAAADKAAANKDKKARGLGRKKDKSPQPATPAATDNNLDFSDFSEEALSGAAPTATTNGAAVTNGSADGSTQAALSGGGKAARAKGAKKGVKSGTFVGLNIGNDSIKVIEVRSKGGDLAITGMGSVPTPQESMANGVVMSVTTLAHAVQDALKQAGIKSRGVVSSVSGTGALVVRVIEVPKMSDSELSDNMAVDAERYIPFPASEVTMDFKALRELPSDPDSPNMEVLLAAAQREIIDLHVRVLEEAKLDPLAIDVEPLAAARTVLRNIGSPDDNSLNGAMDVDVNYNDVTALLNIGATGTEISILRGDLLVFTRTVPTGGYALTQGILDYLGMAWDDAERLKRELGDALPPHTTGGTGGVRAPHGGTPAAPEEDWSEFGLFDADPSAAAAPAAAAVTDPFAADASIVEDSDWEMPVAAADSGTTATGTPAAGSTQAADETADPFDLDFFSQGPRNDEPTERHAQKEDKPTSGFDFSFGDEPVTSTNTPAGADPGTGSTASDEATLPTTVPSMMPPGMEDDDDVTALPTATQTDLAAETSQPLAYGSVSGFNEPQGVDAPAPSFAMPGARGEEDDDLARLPAVASGFSPTDSSTVMASAFDFPTEGAESTSGNLPTLHTEGRTGAAPVDAGIAAGAATAAAGAAAATGTAAGAAVAGSAAAGTAAAGAAPSFAASGFQLDDVAAEPAPAASPAHSTPAPSAPAGFGFDFDALDAPAETAAPAAPASDAVDDLDLDSLIGSIAEPPAEAPATPLAATVAPGAATTGVAPGAAGDDLSDLINIDDFAPAATAATPTDDFGVDLDSFGVGLGQGDVAHEMGVDAETLYTILHPILETLVNEVRRSLEYHASRYPDAAVGRITIVGGGARLKNIDAYFTEALGIPTAIGNPLVRMSVQSPKLAPDYVESNGPAFATALGLAIRDLV